MVEPFIASMSTGKAAASTLTELLGGELYMYEQGDAVALLDLEPATHNAGPSMPATQLSVGANGLADTAAGSPPRTWATRSNSG